MRHARPTYTEDDPLRGVDLAMGTAGFLLRAGLYIGLSVFAQRDALGEQVLTGVLCADLLTWLVMLLVRTRTHRLFPILEFVLYAVVIYVWHRNGGAFVLPEDAQARGVIMLAFGMTFTVKIVPAIRLLLHRSPF